jgi:hypothetical protein
MILYGWVVSKVLNVLKNAKVAKVIETVTPKDGK